MRYIVTLKGKTYEVEVDEEGASLVDERVAQGQPAAPIVREPSVPAARPAAAAAAPAVKKPAPTPVPAGSDAVTAPMAGSIAEVRVREGQQVSEGDVVVILEAMKMENEIVAARSGVVSKVCVSRGQTVQADDTLVVIA